MLPGRDVMVVVNGWIDWQTRGSGKKGSAARRGCT
jgi:hypothetical protein